MSSIDDKAHDLPPWTGFSAYLIGAVVLGLYAITRPLAIIYRLRGKAGDLEENRTR